jgi:hypothetical protein
MKIFSFNTIAAPSSYHWNVRADNFYRLDLQRMRLRYLDVIICPDYGAMTNCIDAAIAKRRPCCSFVLSVGKHPANYFRQPHGH